MKIQYYLILLAGLVSVFLVAAECGSYTLVPQKIERQASWATINDSEWQFRWKDSPRDQNPRFVYDSRIEMDVTSRATAWFNQSQEIGGLLLATPDISVAGFSQNPFKTENDEWIIREIARQGGPTARQELGITFDPATVPLTFQEPVTAQTSLGVTMTGSRFLAQIAQGDGYITVLRQVHQKDILILITITHPLSASRQADSTARLIRHPSAEPSTQPAGATTVSPEGIAFVAEYEDFCANLYDDLSSPPCSRGSGNCTIGYGHKLHDGHCNGNPNEQPFLNGVTKEGALNLLEKDAAWTVEQVHVKVTLPLNQHQFDTVVSLAFNLRPSSFTQLLQESNLNGGNISGFSAHIKGYNKAFDDSGNLVPLSGLTKRRCDEADLFDKADYHVDKQIC